MNKHGHTPCITNSEQFKVSSQTGVYGNVGSSNDSDQLVWGKLRDLYILKPGDLVLFYVKGDQILKGIYRIISNPYICSDNFFKNSTETYPFRFNFEVYEYYPEGIPAFEFYSLIEKGIINSTSSLERDTMASYRSIRQLSVSEYGALHSLFKRYNPNINEKQFSQIGQQINSTIIQAIDFDTDSIDTLDEPMELVFDRIPYQNNYARYETILQTYIIYNLIHDKNSLRDSLDLKMFTELLLEAPILKAMQHRSDIVAKYRNDLGTYFHSFIELKRNKKIKIKQLSQLIGYLKSFGATHNLPINSFEGIYISTSFHDDVKKYLANRASVEREKIVRLFNYSVVNGEVEFEKLFLS